MPWLMLSVECATIHSMDLHHSRSATTHLTSKKELIWKLSIHFTHLYPKKKTSSNETRRYINIMSVHLCNWMMVEIYGNLITLDFGRPGQRMPRIEIKWTKEGRKRYTIYLFCSTPSIPHILFSFIQLAKYFVT